MAAILIQQISKSFGGSTALSSLDLNVADGEFVALLGPSGCGKTTLLRIIAGLETSSSGSVLIGDRDVSNLRPAQRGLAMVFQNYAVFPHLTVFENVAFGLRMQKREDTFIRNQVQRASELLQITPYLDRYPAKLSGGQRQRVAVARALAVQPAVLLMDEPLSNLDALLRLEMRADLKSILKESGTTTLYVTHDQTEAMGLADRIAVMNKGVIEQIDTPVAIYAKPATMFVGGFVGSPPMNFIRIQSLDRRLGLDYPNNTHPTDKPVYLGFRGEDVALNQPGQGFDFEIHVVEPMGSHSLLTGHIDGQRVRVSTSSETQLTPGMRCGLKINPKRFVMMDCETQKVIRDE